MDCNAHCLPLFVSARPYFVFATAGNGYRGRRNNSRRKWSDMVNSSFFSLIQSLDTANSIQTENSLRGIVSLAVANIKEYLQCAFTRCPFRNYECPARGLCGVVNFFLLFLTILVRDQLHWSLCYANYLKCVFLCFHEKAKLTIH